MAYGVIYLICTSLFTSKYEVYACRTMPSNGKKRTCTCPSSLKNYICKHIISMSIRLKYCKPPLEAKNIEIGSKRKRGRPAKAKKALLLQ